MYLYGASGHAKVIIEILEACNIKVEGIFDDNPGVKELLGYAVDLYESSQVDVEEIIISIGDNQTRKKIRNNLLLNYGNAFHPSAVISKRAKIGSGTVIMGNAIINSDCFIGDHVIVNTSSSIDHDCSIDNYVHISPNATLCGGVSVGEGTHIGAASVIIPGVKVGKWCAVGAGSVIIRDIPDGCTVVGNPGRIIKSIF